MKGWTSVHSWFAFNRRQCAIADAGVAEVCGSQASAQASAFTMPDRRVTVNAGQRFTSPLGMAIAGMRRHAGAIRLIHGARHGSMAALTVVLEDAQARCLHEHGLFEVLSGELLAMSPAVFGFGDVLGDEGFRQVAVDAHGGGVVTCLLPRVVLRLHDVTIDTRRGIGAEVREPFGVAEGVTAHASQRP